MAHEGFFRNFEGVIHGLLRADVDVHVHYSKKHKAISMDDYGPSEGQGPGRLTVSTNPPGTTDVLRRVERIRILRDLVLYSRPPYQTAVDLQARFADLQRRGARSEIAQRFVRRVLRFSPEAVKDVLEAMLRWLDGRIRPFKAASTVIDTLRPDYVIVTPMVNFGSREVDLVKAARRKAIPTLLAVASWDNLTNKGRIKVAPDRIAVWNDAMAREAIELHGASRDRIWVTGATVFDSWFSQSPTRDRETFLRSIGLQPDRPLVLYLCSTDSISGAVEHEIVGEWLSAVRSGKEPALEGVNVLVRPHPMANTDWNGLAKVDEHGVASWRSAVIWPLGPKHPTNPDTRADFFDALYHADAVVGLNTSAMIEAAILGRPVFTFLGHSRLSSQTGNLHFRYLAEGGFVFRAGDVREHVEQLAAHLGGGEDVSIACSRFVADFVRPLGRDVDAWAALVDRILDHMGRGRRAESAAGRDRLA
jgi:hypothetical protein